MGDKQDKLVSKTEEVATPLTQFTQNTYLPDGKGSRLSEVHQIKTTEKSPKGNPAVLLILENLRAKYNTKFYLLDRYLGYLYAVGGETIGPDPIEEKGWIHPTGSTKPIVSALDEFRLTPYHTLQISTIKGTPEAEFK